jgi:hypothetical protein
MTLLSSLLAFLGKRLFCPRKRPSNSTWLSSRTAYRRIEIQDINASDAATLTSPMAHDGRRWAILGSSHGMMLDSRLFDW